MAAPIPLSFHLFNPRIESNQAELVYLVWLFEDIVQFWVEEAKLNSIWSVP